MEWSVKPGELPRVWLRPKWRCLLARLFGERSEHHDGGFTMICYQWRGKLWVWDWYHEWLPTSQPVPTGDSGG